MHDPSGRDRLVNAGATPNTISQFENGGDALASTIERLQTALENAGVIFIDADKEGPGVRLRVNQVGQ